MDDNGKGEPMEGVIYSAPYASKFGGKQPSSSFNSQKVRTTHWQGYRIDQDVGRLGVAGQLTQVAPPEHTRDSQQPFLIPPRKSSLNFSNRSYAAGAYALTNPHALILRQRRARQRELLEQAERNSGHATAKDEQLHSLERTVQVTKKEKEDLISQMEQVLNTITDMQTQMDAVTAERDRFERTYKELKSERDGFERTNKELSSERDGFERRTLELRSELVGGRMEKRYWIDDDYLVCKWKELDSQIRQITAIRFGEPQPTILGGSRRLFGDLVNDENAWLMGHDRSWLIHAFIWITLVDRVFGERGFSESGCTVMGKMQDSVEYLLRTLRAIVQDGSVTRQDYQDLKAKLTMILSPSPSELDSERLAQAARELEIQLSPLTSPDVESDFYIPFTELVEAAVRLDAELAQCRAIYQISMYPPQSHVKFGFAFDKASMTDVFGHDGRTVTLVVAPMLSKIGDSRGEKYDQERLLAPRRVISL